MSKKEYITISLVAKECHGYPTLENIANFMKDLVYLYDRILLLSYHKDHKSFIASSFYRRHYREYIKRENRLEVLKISKESPISLDLKGIAEVIKAFTELLKLIRDWKLNRESNCLDVERGKLENEKLRLVIDNLKEFKTLPQDMQLKLYQVIERDLIRITKNEIIIEKVIIKKDSNVE